MTSEWDKNSAGNIALQALVNYEALDFYGIAVGLRLEISPGPDPDGPRIFVQLSMDVDRAQDLANLLQMVVDHIQAQKPQAPTN